MCPTNEERLTKKEQRKLKIHAKAIATTKGESLKQTIHIPVRGCGCPKCKDSRAVQNKKMELMDGLSAEMHQRRAALLNMPDSRRLTLLNAFKAVRKREP
jgi:hypothetical protein